MFGYLSPILFSLLYRLIENKSMNLQATNKLTGVIELLLAESSRINQAKPEQYWYPLSMATYGVEEIVEALDSMCSFRTSMWEKTLQFEQDFAKWQGSRHAVMVNSGSSADLLLSLLLTDPVKPYLNPGDEILVPIVTWATHAWSPMMAGLNVKFVDVSPLTLNIDFADLESKITDRTKAIFIVHLMGNPVDMDRLAQLAIKHNLIILEDCCEAMGATFGSWKVGRYGVGASFSFFFSHHITTMEGGMIVTDDDEVADTLRVLRAHGWTRNSQKSEVQSPESGIDSRYQFVNWGLNVRPTEVQASFGIHQLAKVPLFTVRREILSQRFFAYIDNQVHLTTPHVHMKARPSWLALPIMLNPHAPFSKQMLTEHLEQAGVETRPMVAGNLQRQPVAAVFPELFQGHFPGADVVHENGFYVGLSPMLTPAMIDRLSETFDVFLRRY